MPWIRRILTESIYIVQPIFEAVKDEASLIAYLRLFGYDVSLLDARSIIVDIDAATPTLISAFTDLVYADNPDAADILDFTQGVFSSLQTFCHDSRLQSIVDDGDGLFLEIFDNLSFLYLAVRMPFASVGLQALGVITSELIKTSDPGGRQLDYARIKFNWSRLGRFIDDNGRWAYEVYGWAGNPSRGDDKSFDYAKAISNIVRVVHAAGLSLVHQREIVDPAETALFLKNIGDEKVFEAFLPFQQDDLDSFADDGTPIFSREVGLRIAPFGDLIKPEKLGLALAPYVKGAIPDTQQLSEKMMLDLLVSSELVDGAYLTITPDGIDVVGGEAIDTGFDFSAVYDNPDQSPIVLAGDAQSTRLQTVSIFGAIGGNMRGDFYLEVGIVDLKVVIDFSEDGFLGALISDPIEIDAGDVIMGWRPGRGVYFEGGTNLGVSVPLNLDLGVILIRRMNILLNMETDVSVLITFSLEARLGPIIASPENVGLHVNIARVSSGTGALGKYDLSFGFVPPTSIGLSIDAEGITGGGFLKFDPPNYAGMMQLSYKNEIDLTAFGLITTKLPDGRDGFSLVIQIMAEFQPMQIGLGFALTGVGGLIGINRQLCEEGMKAAFKTHALNVILFPQSPIKDAVKIIESIQSIMPPREGYHIIGPMAKLFWGGSMRLIEFEVGIFIQLGGPLKIIILGQAWSHLPRGDNPRLVINVDVLGILDFGEERLAIDAVLYNSRILKFTLDGKMALRADWSSGEENFALSVGGFHPRFQAIPPGFPQLSRLLVAVGSDNPKLTLSLYLAITPNTLQIGAHVDLWAKKLGLTITGGAGFDALFTFSPFSFLIVFNVWVNVRGWIDLGVWLELELSGPNPIVAAGYAKFKIGWFTKKIRFRKEFGEKIPEPLPAVSPLAALIAELGHPRSIRFQLPAWASANLVFTKDAEAKIDPIADVIIIQNAVPLNFTLERFGGGTPPEAEQRLALTADLDAEREKAVQSLFAPEQFKNWTADERLSARPFEKYDAGIRFSGEYVIPEDHLEEREIVFETVLRESKTYREQLPKSDYRNIAVRTTCLWQPEMVLLANWSLFGSQSYYKPLRKGRDESHPNYVKVVEPGFNLSVNEAVDGKFVSAALDGVGEGQMTYAEALEVSKQIKDAQILIRSKVDMMPT